MATEKHGLEVILTENVGAAVKAAAKAVGWLRVGLNQAGSAAGAAFSVAGAGVVVFNQGLELAKKGVEIFRATIGAAISKSLEFRSLNDETAGFFRDMAREAELVQARVGDALLPVIRGFAEAVGFAKGSVSEWIAVNRKLIGSTLIEWIDGAAKALTTGLAAAVSLVGKMWLGWKAAIEIVKVAVSEFFAFALRGIRDMLGGFAKVVDLVGLSGMAKSIGEAESAVGGLADEFERSSDAASGPLQETAAALAAFDSKVKQVEVSIKEGIGRGMELAQQRVQESTRGATKNIEEQRAELDKLNASIDAIAAKRSAAHQAGADRFEADARAADAKEQADAAAGAGGGAAGALLGGLGDFGAIASAAMQEGLVGAITAAVGAVISASEPLQKMLGNLADIFGDVVKTLDPLFKAIEPVIESIQSFVGTVLEALAPVFKALADVLHPIAVTLGPIVNMLFEMHPLMLLLKLSVGVLAPVMETVAQVLTGVGRIILKIAKSLAGAWNGIVGAIASVLKKLGGISVWGSKPLGFLEDWGKDLEKKASISTASIDEAQRQLDTGWQTAAENLDDGAGLIKDTVKDMGRQLHNVPEIVKTGLLEFNAIDPRAHGIKGTRAVDVRADVAEHGSTRGSTILADIININAGGSLDDIIKEVAKEGERTGRRNDGPLSGNGRESTRGSGGRSFADVNSGIGRLKDLWNPFR